ncbi:MAG: tRNA-dihydrouridine synthase [Patescibacteria group bacterium]
MESFWKSLPKPFFVLAPMADVTDPAYRALIAQMGKPDVTWTEFVSADGLYHTREPRKDGTRVYEHDADNPLMRDLLFTEAERPIVAQLFSSKPEMMAYAAKLCASLGFDGIDINMGCPVGTIVNQGCGAAMIQHPDVAKAVIAAARASGLPVSVKTRIGYNAEEIDTWLATLLEQKLDALTVHLRTRKEMSKVAAHWELMPRILALRDRICPDTLILGNGDVDSLEDARQKVAESGCDGIMLGRAIFGNPWLFDEERSTENIAPGERIEALAALARSFDELRPRKSFHILKKHIKAFITGWDGASGLRTRLMEATTLEDFQRALRESGV